MTPVKDGVPLWTCAFADPATGSNKLDNLTVGQIFAMTCRGDLAVEWGSGPVKVTFPNENQAYSLVILNAEKLSANEAIFSVTGYQPGEHKPEYIRVLQGAKGFEFDKPQWTIRSVLKPNEQPKPYGPYGPFTVGLPAWLAVAAILILVALVAGIVAWLRRRYHRRLLKKILNTHRSALPPAHQFYRDARATRRHMHTSDDFLGIARELNHNFRLFLMRRFEVLTLDVGDGAIAAELRRRHRAMWALHGDQLRRTLRELGRLITSGEVTALDVDQLHRMSLNMVEQLDTFGSAR